MAEDAVDRRGCARPQRARQTAARLVDAARKAGDLWHEATGTRLEGHAASRLGDLNAASGIFTNALDLNVVEHLDRADLQADAAVALGAFSTALGAARELVSRAVRRLNRRLRTSVVDDLYVERHHYGAGLATGELLVHLDETLRAHAAGP